ncbi:DNA replication regulator SLD3-domain-containing protein [Hypomontagnella submonticulosa]|nr:DNA replication regulator SLD3-domain-containing protein [Hypomontagnella submonticulosa]
MPSGTPRSDASRLLSGGILMHSPVARLNLSQDSITGSSPSQRHRRDGEAMEELLKPSIVVKSHPRKLSVKPRSLQPLMLLPREHLQLSFLDLSLPFGSFESSRCYESNIKILDLEGRMGSRPVVLIARLESDKTLYALERQINGVYTLCKLCSWVDLRELQQLATVSLPKLIEKWTSSAVNSTTSQPLTTPRLHHDTKKRRLAIEAIQSLVKKPARSRSASTVSQFLPPTQLPTPSHDNAEPQPDNSHVLQDGPSTGTAEPRTESQGANAVEMDEMLTVPTAQSIFENIRNQYFEYLYHSMGSLAYFAKGPLSRARATFHLDCDANLEMNDLVEFLKSLVMTTAQIDKKYRETIPEIISKMKPIFQDSDDERAKAKKRRSKKMRIGKDGLYPMEYENVRKWWGPRKPSFKDDEAMTTTEPQYIKYQLACLRSRETQLQMIIILEILALEPLVAAHNNKDPQLPGLPGLEDTPTEAPKDTPPKKRNRHNLPSLVDVHADRLCIWQSTALDVVKFPATAQISKEMESQNSSKFSSDPLKDFCVDIVMPFFSSRLPEKCDSINRKLGGPVIMPPPKPKAKKQEKTEPAVKAKSKPSSVAKRPTSSKPARTLERVLSKETERNRRSISRGPGGVIALMRSASTSLLKREASEPLSMMSIPKADSAPSKEKASRPLLSAPTKRKLEEEKAKKEALVKAELQDAISSLRRPNRDVVGKAMAEADERRAITSLSQLRKSRKPTQHPRLHDVVKATPVGQRFKDVLGGGVSNQPIHFRGAESIEAPSSSYLVPSTGRTKRSHEAAFGLDDSPTISRSRREPATQVEATPARPSGSKYSFPPIFDADEEILASSPIMSRKGPPPKSFHDSGIGMPSSPINGLTETPLKPRVVAAPMDGLIASTPAKRRALDKDTTIGNIGKPAITNGEEPPRKLSIFERLGWDDDFDELS